MLDCFDEVFVPLQITCLIQVRILGCFLSSFTTSTSVKLLFMASGMSFFSGTLRLSLTSELGMHRLNSRMKILVFWDEINK